jgi:RNA polymerase sigma factor (sigma-70 family)
MPTDREFEKLLTNALPTLQLYCKKLTRNRERAEDLCQDACLKAWTNRAKYTEGNYIGWLKVLTRNTYLNQVIVEGRMKYTDGSWATGHGVDISVSGDDNPYTEHLHAKYLSEPANQEDAFLENQIHAAIASLPPHTALLIQQKLKGLTYEQIAKALGIKANNAKQRYFNDIKTLRALLLKLGLLDN